MSLPSAFATGIPPGTGGTPEDGSGTGGGPAVMPTTSLPAHSSGVPEACLAMSPYLAMQQTSTSDLPQFMPMSPSSSPLLLHQPSGGGLECSSPRLDTQAMAWSPQEAFRQSRASWHWSRAPTTSLSTPRPLPRPFSAPSRPYAPGLDPLSGYLPCSPLSPRVGTSGMVCGSFSPRWGWPGVASGAQAATEDFTDSDYDGSGREAPGVGTTQWDPRCGPTAATWVQPGSPSAAELRRASMEAQAAEAAQRNCYSRAMLRGSFTTRPLRLRVVTYNVGRTQPTPGVEHLVSELVSGRLPEVVVVGLQEVEMGFIPIVTERTDIGDRWAREIEVELQRHGPYYRVAKGQKQVVGLVILVYVHESVARQVGQVCHSVVRTGVAGVMGNKGAIGVRLLLCGKRFLFVAAHLAPHTEEAEKRNAEYVAIVSQMKFPKRYDYESELDQYLRLEQVPAELRPITGSSEKIAHKGRGVKFLAYDYIFFFGDLNYRIDLPPNCVMELINASNWAALRQHEQLILLRSQGRCFNPFSEGELNFPPTYRYHKRSTVYDITPPQCRTPSWTDRVLYYYTPCRHGRHTGNALRLLAYHPMTTLQSDHRPLLAEFDVMVRHLAPGILQSVACQMRTAGGASAAKKLRKKKERR